MTSGNNKSGQKLVAGALVLMGTASLAYTEATHGGGEDPEGAEVFLTYCAGCHGIDGFAAYPAAPSFSMGERLHKDDDTLLQSVLNGKGAMPYWEGKLPRPMLRSTIRYLRIMEARVKAGQAPRQRSLPARMFRFQPTGEREPAWWRSE
jgi:mono/diheme cytochrome c family protein